MGSLIRLAVFLPLVTWATPGIGASSVSWLIDETINRGEESLFWTSPSAIDLGLSDYLYDYEITKITAVVLGQSIDVTEQIGESFDLTGSGGSGSPPFVLIDQALSDPTTGTTADIRIEVDAGGFGQAAFTDVVLGQASLGPLRLNISSVRFEGAISLEGLEPFDPADYNADRAVDRNDHLFWANNYGTTTGAADGNTDGFTNAADYTVWRDRFDSPLSALAVPEPAGLTLMLSAGGLLGGLLNRRR